MQDTDDVAVQSLRRTDRILEVIRDRGSAGASEIATELEKPVSTVHNHLTSLRQLGYLVKASNDAYRLSYQFLEFGGERRHRSPLFKAAQPHLASLAEETGDIVNLMVLEHGSAVILDLHYGEDAIDIDSYMGMRVPIYLTANGKSMLAHMPSERIDTAIDHMDISESTANSITSEQALRSELKTVSEEGVAYDDEERLENLRCVGAPILDEDTVLGGISVSAPTGRMGTDRFRERLPEQVKLTAELITITRSRKYVNEA